MERQQGRSSGPEKSGKENTIAKSVTPAGCNLPIEDAIRICISYVRGNFRLGYDDSQDVTQNAVIKSYLVFARDRKPADEFIPYTLVAARNGAIDHLRRRGRFISFEDYLRIEDIETNCAYDTLEETRMQKDILNEVLSEESPLAREIFILKLDGNTLPEISEILHMTSKKQQEKVRRIYYKVRKKLIRRYTERCQ